MNLNNVASALAALVRGVDGIMRSDDTVPDSATPPHFYVGEIQTIARAGDPANTFGGKPAVTFVCRLLVGHTSDANGQRKLRTFMRESGPTSVTRAIEGTPGVRQDLGGLCDDLFVPRIQGHRMYTIGTNKYYGAEWIVRVFGSQDED